MFSFIGVAVVLVSLHSIRNSNKTQEERKKRDHQGVHISEVIPQRLSGLPYKMEKQQHEMTITVLSVALEFLVSVLCKQKR